MRSVGQWPRASVALWGRGGARRRGTGGGGGGSRRGSVPAGQSAARCHRRSGPAPAAAALRTAERRWGKQKQNPAAWRGQRRVSKTDHPA